MIKKVYILKHVPNEDAGTIRDYLIGKNIAFESVNLYDGEPLPSLDKVRSAVIMGGPMNVYEEDKHPFLKDENLFIQNLLNSHVPIFGVCLGSQLIVKAMGAKVMKAPAEEIGRDTVRLNLEASKDPLFSAARSDALKVLQWHGDTFELPPGAVHLAESKAVKNQAFRLGGNVYGLQFHVEVNRPMLENWFEKRPDLQNILKEFDEYEARLSKITGTMYERFFSYEPA